MNKGMSNPAVILAATEIAKTDAGKKAIEATGNAVKLIFMIGGVVLTGWYANKKYKEWRVKKYLTENASKKEVQLAMLFRGAMKRLPSIDLLWTEISIPDGTDEDLINLLGRNEVSIDLISKAYKIIFDSVLLTDINSELSGTELQTFFKGVNATGTDNTTPANSFVHYLKNQTIWVRKKDTPLATRRATKQNGHWIITNDSKGQFTFGEKIGSIYDIKIHPNGEIDYIIDTPWDINATTGFAVANHREVINNNPNTN